MYRFAICALVALAGCTSVSSPENGIIVTSGPTSIPRGDALSAGDITVRNDHFAIAFAAGTQPPWGVPPGGIIDIAPVRNGKVGYDIASLVDFMPDNWSSWPTSYQDVSVASATPEEVIIRSRRDWHDVELETLYRIRRSDTRVHITTRMTNNGKEDHEDLLTGYVAWPDGGHLIETPVQFVDTGENGSGGWTGAYDENWFLGLHAAFSEITKRRGRDRYIQHTLHAGESSVFEVWLQIESHGSSAPIVQTEINGTSAPSGTLCATVSDSNGAPVPKPAIIIQKGHAQPVWVIGSNGYAEMTLAAGQYTVYAAGQRYSDSDRRHVVIATGEKTCLEFSDLAPPGRIAFSVMERETKLPLDARISIRQGHKSVIGFWRQEAYFTELDEIGHAVAATAPGKYLFEVSAGGGFLSMPEVVDVQVRSNQVSDIEVPVLLHALPSERGWYAADLHHHSDVLDGFTAPEYVLRSQLAAGIDMAFLSDHDSVVNNSEMQRLSDVRGTPFIPGTEISPSWGHFNAYPIYGEQGIEADFTRATVHEVFAAAREKVSGVIEVNHPYSDYGYFTNLEKGTVPGGQNNNYNLLEITSTGKENNNKTVADAWALWNLGKPVYLAGGSDVHNVWRHESGTARTYAFVPGVVTPEKYVAAVKHGHAYATQGPLVFPDRLFGTEVSVQPGEQINLAYSLVAVNELKSIQLIERGQVIGKKTFSGGQVRAGVSFELQPETNTWYSVVIEDNRGRRAFSNPLWIVLGPS
jgi:hypothetical protein